MRAPEEPNLSNPADGGRALGASRRLTRLHATRASGEGIPRPGHCFGDAADPILGVMYTVGSERKGETECRRRPPIPVSREEQARRLQAELRSLFI
jgi:hypothetical protein